MYVREAGTLTREVADHVGKFLSASKDGAKILLDDGCLYDLLGESCEDLTEGQGGFLGVLGQSDDLSHLYYVDSKALTGPEEENANGEHAEAGADNLYAWAEGGPARFVARLLDKDNLAAAKSSDWAVFPSERTAQASPNGRYLAFLSQAPLTGYDNVGPCEEISGTGKFSQTPCPEVFIYDSAAAELRCASCNRGGAAPLGWSVLRLINGAPHQARYLSDSGRLYFDSEDSLSPADTNEGAEDVYQYEPGGVGDCKEAQGCVDLISAGSEAEDSNFLAADATGANVFFTTRDRLRARDRDDLIDLYDAREDGGIAAETETSRAECQGEACQPAPVVPEAPNLGSAALRGGGNLGKAPRKPRCPKGKRRVRRKGRFRCVARRPQAPPPRPPNRQAQARRPAMSARARALALAAAILALAAPAAARADFGIAPGSTSMSSENRNGTTNSQAGSHPYAFNIHFALKTDSSGVSEGGEMRDIAFDLPPGLLGNPQAVPRCPRLSFEGAIPQCSPSTQVGVVRAISSALGEALIPLYNIAPPPQSAAQLGFSGAGLTALAFASVGSEGGYPIHVSIPNLPLEVTEVTATIWGAPADPDHKPERGNNGGEDSDAPLRAFFTLPTSCAAPPELTVAVDSKTAPGVFSTETGPLRDKDGAPLTLSGCDAVPFAPKIASQPTTHLAESGSGLDFELSLPNQGLLAPGNIAESEPERVLVTLPEGVTLNPSAAAGIGVCSEAAYRSEALETKAGAGCPEAAKIGSIVAHSPLLEEPLEGALYLAEPYANPTGSLIALYLVARAPERGVLVKQAGRVEPDPQTGRLLTTFAGLPPLPYSDFKLHFREGGRAPLISPPACGSYQTDAELTPFSAPTHPYTASAAFAIERGVDGGACPAAELPFNPGFAAGTLNNAAGRHSPLEMRLTRKDGDQDLTKLSSTLPPGLLASLAGVGRCTDAEIARAQSRTGPHGGAEEQADPSCPAASQIGHTDTGAGVGGTLLYVPGNVYLAGPYKGAPLSVVAIVPGVAGPFDVGTIVVRIALRFDPRSAQAEVDGSASDPIPHILRGIPLKVRDIRVHIDRPDWTFNPTSCEPLAVGATLWGGGQDPFNTLDDSPHSLAARFQAADCAALAFKPRLALRLKGGAKRGGHPALRGEYRPRKADANLKGLVLRLPRSAFLDQAHIRTICTRVQYAAGRGNGSQCPKGSIYGHARAFTPLLDEPLEGPVYLRSSNHNLPDFVAALHGIVDIEAVARIDSKGGGIRATFTDLPDAPITKVIVSMQGAKKGLIVNSTNICAAKHRANALFGAHNGRRRKIKPVVGARCGKHEKRRHRAHRRAG